ncbi:MAG: tetratricopeptide repeat protein [Magnetococcales bacterium]|nr:tetratricopeptide repeat protein [Magnetococcales bacterium]
MGLFNRINESMRATRIKRQALLTVVVACGWLGSSSSVYAECVRGNCADGFGTFIWPSGSRYSGDFKNGVRHGAGSFQFPAGDIYVGEYSNGVRHGKGTFVWRSGKKYVGEWVSGRQHGYGIKTWPDGRRQAGLFENDVFVHFVQQPQSDIQTAQRTWPSYIPPGQPPSYIPPTPPSYIPPDQLIVQLPAHPGSSVAQAEGKVKPDRSDSVTPPPSAPPHQKKSVATAVAAKPVTLPKPVELAKITPKVKPVEAAKTGVAKKPVEAAKTTPKVKPVEAAKTVVAKKPAAEAKQVVSSRTSSMPKRASHLTKEVRLPPVSQLANMVESRPSTVAPKPVDRPLEQKKMASAQRTERAEKQPGSQFLSQLDPHLFPRLNWDKAEPRRSADLTPSEPLSLALSRSLQRYKRKESAQKKPMVADKAQPSPKKRVQKTALVKTNEKPAKKTSSPGGRKYYWQGKRELDKGKYQSAIRSFGEALIENKMDLDAALGRGMAYLKAGSPAQSLADFDLVLRVDNTASEALLNRAIANRQLKEFAASLEDLNRLIDQKPTESQGYEERGKTLGTMGRFEEAEVDLNKALSLSQSPFSILFQRGQVLAKMGKYERAIIDLSQAIRGRSEEPIYFFERGNAYSTVGKMTMAVKDYDRAIALSGDVSEFYFARAFAYQDLMESGKMCLDLKTACNLGDGQGCLLHKKECN